MKKGLRNVLFVIYAIIAIFVTICLLSYNDFKVTEFGDKVLVIITDATKTPGFNEGDLVIVDKKEPIITGRSVFYYTTEDRKMVIETAKVNTFEKVTQSQKTYELEGERKISSDYVIGTTENVDVLPHVGTVLRALESKWGFLFLIILPSLLAFIYQITVVFSDLKNAKEEKAKEEKAKLKKKKGKANA